MTDAARESGRAGDVRDLVDGLTSAWRREMPEVDRIDVEMTRRAARLGVILQDRLQDCLMPYGLTRADFSVLNVLRSTGQPYELRPTDLGVRLLLSSGGVSNVLNRLAKSGLIERERDLRDGRGTWVRLTPRGVEVAGATMRAWAADQEALYRNVTPQMARVAADALREVLVAIGDVEPTAPNVRQHPDAVNAGGAPDRGSGRVRTAGRERGQELEQRLALPRRDAPEDLRAGYWPESGSWRGRSAVRRIHRPSLRERRDLPGFGFRGCRCGPSRVAGPAFTRGGQRSPHTPRAVRSTRSVSG